MPSKAVIQAVAVTAELCGRVLSEPAARVFVEDLAAYPEPAVMRALSRCRREVRGALTVADVIARIDDGRPSADEAWALLPRDEESTVVWTDDMAEAWGIARMAGDENAQRMAFRAAYTRLVQQSREQGIAVHWTASLGLDPRQRDAALTEAARLGRLPAAHVAALLPNRAPVDPQIAGMLTQALPAPVDDAQ